MGQPAEDKSAAVSAHTSAVARSELLSADPNRTGRHASLHYSRFVSVMKIFLPTTALLLIALVVVWPQLDIGDNRFGLQFATLESEANDQSMVNARFVGADRKDQPFTITADLATNLMASDAAVELEMPKADITTQDGSWLVLTANTGVYDQSGKTLDLEGAVNLFHDSGYEFSTKKAAIDLGLGAATSSSHVSGHGPFGELESEGFRIEDKGEKIFFTGKSKATIFSKPTEARQ